MICLHIFVLYVCKTCDECKICVYKNDLLDSVFAHVPVADPDIP